MVTPPVKLQIPGLPDLIESLLCANQYTELASVAERLRATAAELSTEAGISLSHWAKSLIETQRKHIDELGSLRHDVGKLQQTERLQRALYAIAEQAEAQQPLHEVMRRLHDIVRGLTYAENCFFVVYDRQQQTVRFAYYADIADPHPPDSECSFPLHDLWHSPTWYLLRNGRALRGSFDTIADQVDGLLKPIGPTCVDWLGVPLLRDQEVIGAIAVQSYREDARYSDADQTLLTYVAQHIQVALERRENRAELEHRVTQRTEALHDANQVLQQQVLERQRGERLQAALFRIAELAGASDSLETFYAAVHHVVGGLLYARNFYISLLSDNAQELHFPYAVDEQDESPQPRRISRGLSEYVLRHGAALLANRDTIKKLRGSGEVVQMGADPESWLGVPLVIAERCVGALVVQSYRTEHCYTTRDQDLLTFVSYHIANALDRRRAADSLKLANTDLERHVAERTRALALANRDLREQIAERERVERRLKFETLHDSLTGLPNRTLLTQRLEHALERIHMDPVRRFAVLFLDLDRFKIINDSVGHLIGDDLLCQVGHRIRSCLKTQDMVARMGGDEFAVLLEGIEGLPDASQVADRVLTSIQAPFQIGAKEVFTSTSIGIILSEQRYTQPEDLLRDADVAMYQAKSDGRQRWAVFDEQLRLEAVSRLDLEVDLRRAQKRHEFLPFYQPIAGIHDSVIVGYEALMRWQHPNRGILSPDDFLSVADDSGVSEAMDWMIFEQVAGEIERLLGNQPGFVSINLSAKHFSNSGLTGRLLAMLARHGVPPEHLRVEVTERILLDNPQTFNQILNELRGQGIYISLDDFGTGYSSLSYLHQYRLHALKIDRSFITGLADGKQGSSYAVVRAIQALATALDLQLIAEGIENETQRELIAQIGCPYGQGYLFGRPQPLRHWLALRQDAVT